MKKIVTEKVIKDVKYIGNCPVCGKEQERVNKRYVDIECEACKSKRIVKAQDYLKSLGISLHGYSYQNITSISFEFEGKKYELISESPIELDDY